LQSIHHCRSPRRYHSNHESMEAGCIPPPQVAEEKEPLVKMTARIVQKVRGHA
jgi:hypothetical protein